MRSVDPVEKDVHAPSKHRRQQMNLAIGHLQAALAMLDDHGEVPEAGARVEECINSLRGLLEREV